MKKEEIEEGTTFSPRFDDKGLIPCVVTCSHSHVVLMVAYMNEEAIELSRATGESHYWSRSRQEIWHKGATSGNTQKIVTMRTDCDQDCIWISVDMPKNDKGHAVACHTGREGCFYREITLGSDEATLIKD